MPDIKLVNVHDEQPTHDWRPGDFFTISGNLRQVVIVGGTIVIMNVETGRESVMFSEESDVEQAMARYISINGKVTRLVVEELRYREL